MSIRTGEELEAELTAQQARDVERARAALMGQLSVQSVVEQLRSMVDPRSYVTATIKVWCETSVEGGALSLERWTWELEGVLLPQAEDDILRGGQPIRVGNTRYTLVAHRGDVRYPRMIEMLGHEDTWTRPDRTLRVTGEVVLWRG